MSSPEDKAKTAYPPILVSGDPRYSLVPSIPANVVSTFAPPLHTLQHTHAPTRIAFIFAHSVCLVFCLQLLLPVKIIDAVDLMWVIYHKLNEMFIQCFLCSLFYFIFYGHFCE